MLLSCRLLLMATFVTMSWAGPGCASCIDTCGINFTLGTPNPYGKELNLVSNTPKNVAAGGRSCFYWEQLKQKYPEFTINTYSREEFAGSPIGENLIEDRFGIISESLEWKRTWWELLELDAPWVSPLEAHLETLDIDVSDLDERWLHYSKDDRLLCVPHRVNQLTIYYREDIFERHGVTYGAGSWDEFTAAMEEVQRKERAARGNDDFWALGMGFSSANTRMTLMTAFLSGFDGGGIVEADGRVTINNPKGWEAMELPKRWANKISPLYAYPFGSRDIRSRFYDGTFGAIFGWSGDSDRWLKQMEDVPGWRAAVGPVPGPNGAGTSGFWSTCMSKYIRHKQFGIDVLTNLALSTVNATRHRIDQPPYNKKVQRDPALWAEYCATNPILCASIERYPDYWKRLVHRPSKGCGSQYSGCASIMFNALEDVLVGRATAPEAAKQMDLEMKVLLGHWDAAALDSGDGEWTESRVAMVVVVIVSGLILMGLAGFILVQQERMRKPKGCRVPISVMLGLVVASCIAIVVGVIIAESNDAARSISEGLAAQVRVQSLRSMKNQAEGVLFTQLHDASTVRSLTEVKTAAKASLKTALGTVGLDTRSLVVLLDRDTGEVMVTSDKKKQKQFFVLEDPLNREQERVSEWLYEALVQYPSFAPPSSWKTGPVDDTETIKIGSVSVNLVEIEEHADIRTVRWLLLYFVPDKVIMQEATDTLNRTMNLSALLAVAAIVIAVLFAVVLVSPLVQLSMDMERVRLMEVEQVDLERTSLLTELASLLLGFKHMTSMMIEYKAYMPKTMFDEATEEEEMSEGTTAKSKTKSLGSRISTSMASQSSHMTMTRNVGARNMSASRASVVLVQMNNEHDTLFKSSDDNAMFAAFLGKLEEASKLFKAALHSFSPVAPGEVALSWGASGGSAAFDRAVPAAIMLRDGMQKTCAIALSSGKCKAGNIGTPMTRGYGIVGPVAETTRSLLLGGSVLVREAQSSLIFLDAENNEKAKGSIATRAVDIARNNTKITVVYEVKSQLQVAEEEWMYQLEEAGKKTDESELTKCITAICTSKSLTPVADLGLEHEDPVEKTISGLLHRLSQNTKFLPMTCPSLLYTASIMGSVPANDA